MIVRIEGECEQGPYTSQNFYIITVLTEVDWANRDTIRHIPNRSWQYVLRLNELTESSYVKPLLGHGSYLLRVTELKVSS
jgi:hypothetical protein